MAAFDINSPSAALGFGIGKLGSPTDVLSSGIFDRRPIVRDWIYIMFCEYMDCMFRSEWLKDATFKSLVANDRTDWCLKDRKAETESARLSHLR